MASLDRTAKALRVDKMRIQASAKVTVRQNV